MFLRNRWVVTLIFLIPACIILYLFGYKGSVQSVDLSNVKMNDLQLDGKFNTKDQAFKQDDLIILDRYMFYKHKKNKGFFIKVKEKDKKIKALSMVKNNRVTDKTVALNSGIKIGSDISEVFDTYGTDYKQKKYRNGYEGVEYRDKVHHIKIVVLYTKDKVQRIELFKY